MNALLEPGRVPGVTRRSHDRDVDPELQKTNYQSNHLVVVLHVRAVGVERPVGVERHQTKAGSGGGVDLRDVEDVPQFGEVGRDELSARQREKLVVLVEGAWFWWWVVF